MPASSQKAVVPGGDHSNDNQTERSCQNFLVTSALLNSNSVYSVGGLFVYSCGNNKRGNLRLERGAETQGGSSSSRVKQADPWYCPLNHPLSTLGQTQKNSPSCASSSFCLACILHNRLSELACKQENSGWEGLYFIQEQGI